jgi:hypothetical protein
MRKLDDEDLHVIEGHSYIRDIGTREALQKGGKDPVLTCRHNATTNQTKKRLLRPPALMMMIPHK